MINKKIWEDSPSNADVYREDYVNGIQKYIERKNTESKVKRQSFMPPEKLAENRDFYRKLYRDMLGVDKILEEKGSVCEKIYVGEDDMCSIYRLKLYITKEIPFYAMFLIPHREGPVHISFSSLLTCMMLGTVFCNICPLSENLMAKADKWTSPLFALFFVISGAELELGVFKDWTIVVMGVIYILFRSLGKYLGSLVSAKTMKCSHEICKYLGITLLPQAGVALGMCVTAMQLGDEGNLIRNITLFAVLVYELVGPLLTKMALTAAGDIKPMSEEVKNRRKILLENSSQKR